MNVTLLYFEGCPNWKVADQRLAALSAEHELTVERRCIHTAEEAEAAGFRGSPTILVEGRDPFATAADPAGLACRIYETQDGPEGAPTIEQLRAALA